MIFYNLAQQRHLCAPCFYSFAKGHAVKYGRAWYLRRRAGFRCVFCEVKIANIVLAFKLTKECVRQLCVMFKFSHMGSLQFEHANKINKN